MNTSDERNTQSTSESKAAFYKNVLIFAVQADLDGKHTVFLFRRSHHGSSERYDLYFLVRNRDTLRCGFREKYHCMGFPADRRGFDTACAAVDE